MNSTGRKILAGAAAAAAAAAVITAVVLSTRGAESFREKYEGQDLATDVSGMERTGTYSLYLSDHEGGARPGDDVDVDLFDYEAEGEVSENAGSGEKALFTGTGSTVSWTVEVPEAGFYNIYLEYLLPESRGVAAEREVSVNGEIPFEDARNITFTRIWTDGGEVRVDNQGNEIRPAQVEVYDWQKAYCRDDMGFVVEPYEFWFEEGENTLSFRAVNEPMEIRKLTLSAVRSAATYEEYVSAMPAEGSAEADSFFLTIQGEDSTIRSESSLYAKYDRSSPSTVSNSVTHTVLNYVGGETWRKPGQWIEWEFEVPADGWYNIMIKGRQNYSRGSVSSRSVMIDGEIPFDAMKEVSFAFANDWECKELADGAGTPYRF